MPVSPRLEGSCACGSITLVVDLQTIADDAEQAAVELARCHCSQCRKTAGAPFLCVFPVSPTAVELSDRDRLTVAKPRGGVIPIE